MNNQILNYITQYLNHEIKKSNYIIDKINKKKIYGGSVSSVSPSTNPSVSPSTNPSVSPSTNPSNNTHMRAKIESVPDEYSKDKLPKKLPLDVLNDMIDLLPKTFNKLRNIETNIKQYNNIVNNVVHTINNANIDNLSIDNNQLKTTNEIMKKINDINKIATEHINNITFDTLDENTLISKLIDKTNKDYHEHKFSNLLSAFALYIKDYRNIIKTIDNTSDIATLNKISESFKLLKNKINEFNMLVDRSMIDLETNINLFEDKYVYEINAEGRYSIKYKSDKKTPFGKYEEEGKYIYIVIDNQSVYDYYIRSNATSNITNTTSSLLIEDMYNMETFINKMIEQNYGIQTTNNNSIDKILLDSMKELPSIVNTKVTSPILIGGEFTIQDLNFQIIDFVQVIDSFGQKMEKYRIYIEAYNQYSLRYNNYLLYILTILTSDKYNTDLLLFGFINKGLLQMYYAIIKNILRDIKKNDTTSEKYKVHQYFDKYHYFTLVYLEEFIRYVLEDFVKDDTLVAKNNKTTFIIDVNKTIGKPKFMLYLLSHFKDILDSYTDLFQNPVTIYARVNDWGDATKLSLEQKMFSSNYIVDNNGKSIEDELSVKDLDNLKVNKNVCEKITDDTKKNQLKNPIKFTGVYDTARYPDNETISSYMTLATQLSKGKGVLLMTYGYSGTGKSFTLFGSREKQGMLQSTLNSIRGLKEVGFRSYEVYGLGVAFPHYWNNLEKGHENDIVDIYQRIFEHKFEITSNNEINFIESKEYPDDGKSNVMNPTDYLNRDNYTYIQEKQVSTIFKSFEQYTGQLDKHRRKTGRIRTTPNNPDSSRSIVVYDFVLLVDDKYVSFTIIDLPGREEITQSYVETYLYKKYKDDKGNEQYIVPAEYQTSFYKALLSSMAINPIAMALLVPSIIFQTINDFNKKDTSIGQIFNDDFFNNSDITLPSKTKKNKIPIKRIYQNGFEFGLIKNDFCGNICNPPNGQHKIISIKSEFDNTNQVKKDTNTIQYQATVAVFVIDALIMNKRFDVLFQIYRNIINKYMPMDKVYAKFPTDSDKLKFLESIYESDKIKKIQMDTENTIDFYFKEIVDFQYFEAQHEGIYINQNIMGLLKHLVQNILKLKPNKVKEIVKSQPENLDFETQKVNYRKVNFKLYSNKQDKPSDYKNFEPYEPYENIYRSMQIMDKLYANAKGENQSIPMTFDDNSNESILLDAYASDKYFEVSTSTNIPFMGQIVNAYMNPRSIKNKEIKPITNIKIFYLFSNTLMELKCNHQANLLVNTLSLIDAIKN